MDTTQTFLEAELVSTFTEYQQTLYRLLKKYEKTQFREPCVNSLGETFTDIQNRKKQKEAERVMGLGYYQGQQVVLCDGTTSIGDLARSPAGYHVNMDLNDPNVILSKTNDAGSGYLQSHKKTPAVNYQFIGDQKID